VAVLCVVGFCIVWNGRRRRRRILAQHQKETGYADWIAEHQQFGNLEQPPSMSGGDMSAGGFHDSPQSQRPLFQGQPWGAPAFSQEESPVEKVYFSPYSSQYNSPVSGNDQIQAVGREWPIDRKGSVAGSLSGLGRNWGTDKKTVEPEGDKFEMQNVAPVLLHPGNGRESGLTEDDARRGKAL